MNMLIVVIVLFAGFQTFETADITQSLENRLEQVGIDSVHDEIAEKLDNILKHKYETFVYLDSCIDNLDPNQTLDNFRVELMDCLDAALKAPPTKEKQIARIVDKEGKISRFRFRWLALKRLNLPCIRLDMMKSQYEKYLISDHLPKKSSDLLRFNRMCARINKANISLKALYSRFRG